MGSFKPGAGVGGAGSHWSGCHFRPLPEDLRLRSNIEQRYGKGLIPADMTIQDFPVSYEELEPHLDLFEKICGTSGKAGVINGAVQEGGNPFEVLALIRVSAAAQPELSRRRIVLQGGARNGLASVSDPRLQCFAPVRQPVWLPDGALQCLRFL